MIPAKQLVLTIDDDASFNALIKKVIESLGVSVLTCEDPAQFIEYFQKESPSLCVIDLNIGTPGNGFDLIKNIRNLIKSSVPLIVLSGMSDSQSIVHAIELGANDYIVKPTDRTVIASKLSAYLSSRQMKLEQLSLCPVPKPFAEVKMSGAYKLVEIDELGACISGPCLIAKGTTVLLSGEILNDLNPTGPVLTMVLSSSLAPTGGYFIYLEFDLEQDDFLKEVRKWLLSQGAVAEPPVTEPTVTK